jgi:chromosome segregation ATPase
LLLYQQINIDWALLLRDVDWASLLTRVAVGIILAMLGFIARYIWKIFKNQGKAAETIKTLQEKVENYELSVTELGRTNADYRRTIEQVIASNRRLRKRLDSLEEKIETEEKESRQRIKALEEENAALRLRVAELEAVSPIEPIRKRGAEELNAASDGFELD